ncbi:hypothetical protein Droror1_Dr00023049 [Drosera rotundifolia]
MKACCVLTKSGSVQTKVSGWRLEEYYGRLLEKGMAGCWRSEWSATEEGRLSLGMMSMVETTADNKSGETKLKRTQVATALRTQVRAFTMAAALTKQEKMIPGDGFQCKGSGGSRCESSGI